MYTETSQILRRSTTGHGPTPVRPATGHGPTPVRPATGHGPTPVSRSGGWHIWNMHFR